MLHTKSQSMKARPIEHGASKHLFNPYHSGVTFLTNSTNHLDMFIAVLSSPFQLKWVPTLVWNQWFFNLLSNQAWAPMYAAQACTDRSFKNHWLRMQNYSEWHKRLKLQNTAIMKRNTGSSK